MGNQKTTHVLTTRRIGRVDPRSDHSTTRYDLSRKIPLCLKDHVSRQFSHGNHIRRFLELDALRIDELAFVVNDDPWVQATMICARHIRAVEDWSDLKTHKSSYFIRTSHNAAASPFPRCPFRLLALSFWCFCNLYTECTVMMHEKIAERH